MKVIQTIAFLAFMLGAGGIENQSREYQPLAIGIMFIALGIVLITYGMEDTCTKRWKS